MIRLIYGSKGSGKTGKIIDEANTMAKESDGEVVFLTDTDKYRFKLHYDVRLINVCKYNVVSAADLSGFVRGIVAGNADVSHIFIDGVHRMTKSTFDDLGDFFAEMDRIAQALGVELVFTVSAEELPVYMDGLAKEHA